MNYVLIGLLIIIVAILGTLLVITLKKNNKTIDKKENLIPDISSPTPDLKDPARESKIEQFQLEIPIEQIDSILEDEEERMQEITDSSVIARITSTIPGISNLTAQVVTDRAVNNLYKVIIPDGATLTKSKKMEGAFRGFFQNTNGKIAGQANIVGMDGMKDLGSAATITNGVAAVMNVGSMIVGQYYMAEIDSKLEKMNESINKIGDFQQREFKSKILSILTRVRQISVFSSEILENDELRNRKLHTLDTIEGETTQLLQQVNITIDELVQKNQDINYNEYKENVNEFNKLTRYQQILVTVLNEIGKLVYLLNEGNVSVDMSYSIFSTYLEQSQKTQKNLREWHEKEVKELDIDLEKDRISKSGLEGIISMAPGMFDDNWHYKELDKGLKHQIEAQSKEDTLKLKKPKEIFQEDVEIIIKDGKYYYVPTGEME